MNSPAAAVPIKRDGHSIGFNLGVIGISVALGGLGLAYVIDAMSRSVHEQPSAKRGDQIVTRTLGATELTIPAAWLAADDRQGAGFAKQIDLVVTLPLGPDGVDRKIELTLTQRSRVRPSASLLDGVYLHQFTSDQLTGPVGLIGKPLAPQDGQENETVWYDPLNASPFVAKCSAPVADGQPGRCLRTVYLGPGIAAVYSFDDDVLANWKKLDAEMHPLLNQIGAL